ncbi:PI-PLC X domain-containing protein 3-like [Clytia hemisphaerica]|uniref:Phosphatidylinositol-specific phospholipase C X domain-containing protein n=1 Tax=Clytia hemisphaerica TaxID=252671 RepID=A0A7M5XKY6_9CNID
MGCCCSTVSSLDNQFESVETVGNSRARWMTNLDASFTTKPITKLAIPGSHDCGAYFLDASGPVCPDESGIIQAADCSTCTKQIIVRWSRTQGATIIQQLNAGVRYLDMRIGYRADVDDFFFVHALYGFKISKMFEEIQTFLNDNPKEVIILDFQQFHTFTAETHQKFIVMIETYFPNMLYPCNGATEVNMSLNDFWQNQKQIFARYAAGSVTDQNPQFWSNKFINTPWYNTADIDVLLTRLDEFFDLYVSGSLNIHQALLSPQTCTIVCKSCSSLEKDLAIPGNSHIRQWIKYKKQENKEVNVFICDFMVQSAIIPEVLKFNE